MISFDRPNSQPFYDLDSRIDLRQLDLLEASGSPLKALLNNLVRVSKLRNELRKINADIVLSYMVDTSVVTAMALLGKSTPLVISEHSDPATYPMGKIWTVLRQWAHSRAAALSVLNQAAASWYGKRTSTPVTVIPNPVPQSDVIATIERSEQRVITVGRLDYLKGIDLLIQAFADIAVEFPSWRLDIFGEGPDRDKLTSLAEQTGLSHRIALKGRTSKVFQELASSDLFVLSSRTEAFPMALCEAMSQGLCCITTRCSPGIGEILEHDVSGQQVDIESVAELAAAMRDLMANDKKRRQLGTSAKNQVARFSLPAVHKAWNELFTRLVTY